MWSISYFVELLFPTLRVVGGFVAVYSQSLDLFILFLGV